MKGSYKDIMRIAFPVIAGGIAQTSISVADTAMMTRVGTVELAAIGYVSVYYLTLFMIGFAYTKGTQILVARRLGEGDKAACGAIFDNSLLAILGLGVALFLAMLLGSGFFMELLVADEAVRAAGVAYLKARSWGIIFSFIGSVFLSFYMGIGTMRVLLVGVVIMSASNILLNWVLIFGHWGAPAMGIQGAALASNIAEVLAASIFLGNVLIFGIRKKYALLRLRNISFNIIGTVTSISFPIVVQTLIGLFGWMFFFYYIEKMGTLETAISSIVKNIYMFFGLFAWGFSTAAGTIISNLIGQNRQYRVIYAIRNIIILSMLFGIAFSIPLSIFAAEVVEFVYHPSADVIAGSVPVIYVAVIALLIYSASTVLYHSIISIGSVRASLIIEIITILIYVIYIEVVFKMPYTNLTLVWTSEIFYWLLLAVATILYLRTGHWKKIKI